MSELFSSANQSSIDDLEFPSGALDAVPPITVPLDMIVRLSEERLPIVNSSLDWWVTRAKEKRGVPFSL